jgi:hypothetical protein
MEKMASSEIEDRMWVEEYEWVGIVYPQDVHETVAFITPLAFYDRDDGWQTITERRRPEYFPNNGKVTRFTEDFPGQKVNRLYWFRPERNQRSTFSKDTATYSRYLTYSDSNVISEPLAQVFDWSSRAEDLFTVPDLLSQGIPARDCLSTTIYLQYQNRIYGPIRLEPDWHTPQILKPREYNQKQSSFGQQLLLYGYDLGRQKIIELVGRLFVDQNMLGSPVGQTDWSLPHMTIKRLLSASKSLSVKLQGMQQLTAREINKLAALSASSGPEALHLEECVIQRAQYIIRHQTRRIEDLQTLIEELPEDHPLLERARLLEVQRRKEKIEQQYQSEQTHLESLRKERHRAEEELADLNEKIAAADQQWKQKTADLVALETSLSQRLAGLRKEMLDLLTELQVTAASPLIRAQQSAREGTLEAEQPEAAFTLPRQNYFITEKVTTLRNPQDLPWAEIAAQNSISVRHVSTCLAALLAGLIPIMSISAPLQAVAQGIAGLRIWRVPVPLTATAPLALFGHISGERQVFVPVAGELADILIEAQNYPEQLGLIVLEGIDRVPFRPVIEPVLRQYRVVRQHIQQIGEATPLQETLQLFHPRSLVPDDPYQKISRLAWPAHLLLGATLDGDISSFPLPDTYASWFADIERFESGDGMPEYRSGNRKSWQVPPSIWYAWEKEIATRITRQGDGSLLENSEPWQQIFTAVLNFLA